MSIPDNELRVTDHLGLSWFPGVGLIFLIAKLDKSEDTGSFTTWDDNAGIYWVVFSKCTLESLGISPGWDISNKDGIPLDLTLWTSLEDGKPAVLKDDFLGAVDTIVKGGLVLEFDKTNSAGNNLTPKTFGEDVGSHDLAETRESLLKFLLCGIVVDVPDKHSCPLGHSQVTNQNRPSKGSQF